jgi:3-oxoacyl-[acyl-carrier protein] reductase
MDMTLNFAGKTVLVVGGSSGIGNAIAQAFRSASADVHVWGTRATAAEYANDTGSDLGGLHYEQMDAADRTAIDGYRPPFVRLDVLVLSQGAVLYRRQEYEMAGFTRIVDINLNSVMACAVKFQPFLLKAKGSLIALSSTAAYEATIANPAYAASKAGVVGLTRTLGQAWAKDGIRVNGIAPGYVDTKMIKVTTENSDRRAAAEKRIPIGRIGATQEIAGIALFLASPLSTYIVGQTIVADGGMTL